LHNTIGIAKSEKTQLMQVLLKWVITTDPFLATLKIVEQVLKITFTAWNAVVLGTVKGNAQ
jgi:hypothetical protein